MIKILEKENLETSISLAGVVEGGCAGAQPFIRIIFKPRHTSELKDTDDLWVAQKRWYQIESKSMLICYFVDDAVISYISALGFLVEIRDKRLHIKRNRH